MKILHIVGCFANGGMETLLVNTINEQIKRGHEVSVIVINNIINNMLVESFLPNIKFYSIGRKVHSRNPFSIVKTNIVYYNVGADIVHFHNVGLSKILLFKRRKEKWFTTVHFNMRDAKSNYMRDDRLSAYIAVSQTVLDSVRNYFPGANAVLCYNGIALNKVLPRTETIKKVRNFISISRMDISIKRQDLIIKAFAELKKRGYPDIHIDLYGTGPDMQIARKLIEDLDVQDVVSLKDDEKNEVLCAKLSIYDAFIQASVTEGCSMTVIEALASNILLFLSDIDSFREMLECGAPITMFKSGSVSDLVDKLERVIQSPKECHDIACVGRKFVGKYFTIQRQVDRLLSIYNEGI